MNSVNEFDVDLIRLRELTTKLTENGYLVDRARQWEFAFDAVEDLVMIINPKLEVKFVNDSFAKRMGVEKKEIINKKCFEVVTCPNCKKNPNSCLEVEVEDKDVFIEESLYGWFNFSHSPIYDGDENLLGFICILRDITERKEVELMLAESEKKYRNLFNSIKDSILVADIDRNIINFNKAFSQILGYKLDELVGKKTSFIHEDEESYKAFGDAIKENYGNSGFLKTTNYKRKDGTLFPGETGVYYLKDGDDDAPSGYIGVIRDVTKRRKTEDELRKNEEKYRNIHNTMPLAALVYGEDFKVLEWNQGAEKMFGWTKEEILGKNFFDFIVLDKDKERLGKLAHKLRTGVLSVINNVNENKTKDGNIIVCEWFNSVYHNCKGKIIGIISLAMDVTSKQLTENKLRENEALMKSIFKAVPAGIGLMNTDRVINWTNAKLREMTGYNEEELTGKDVRILYPDDDEYNFVGEAKFKQIKEEGIGNIETVWKRKDSRLIKVLLSSSPIDQSDLSKGITFTALDITNL